MKYQFCFSLVLLLLAFVFSLLAFAKCNNSKSIRYVPVKTGWGYNIYDLQSKKWLERQIQLRVSIERTLPEPIYTEEHGNFIHGTKFDPGGCGSANLDPKQFIKHETYKIWQWKENVNLDDFKGKTAFGVKVDKYNDKGESTPEPLEIFPFSAIDKQLPEEWTNWTKALCQREGQFAWWEHVHERGEPEALKVQHPFEIRWRFLLSDIPGRLVDDDTIHVE